MHTTHTGEDWFSLPHDAAIRRDGFLPPELSAGVARFRKSSRLRGAAFPKSLRPFLAKPGVEPYDWYRGELTETFTAKIHVPESGRSWNGRIGVSNGNKQTFMGTASGSRRHQPAVARPQRLRPDSTPSGGSGDAENHIYGQFTAIKQGPLQIHHLCHPCRKRIARPVSPGASSVSHNKGSA